MANLKYKEETKIVTFRVPVSREKEFKLASNKLLETYLPKESDNLKNECDCKLDENGFLRRGKIKCKKSKSQHKF